MSTEVTVFADWEVFAEPELIGTLRSEKIRNREHFSFGYAETWLESPHAQKIDPDLELFQGEQHSHNDNNFRIFLDSCPDRWGRLLMKRKEAVVARQEDRQPDFLGEIDYLLGVHDLHRQGALRFKKEMEGDFLDNNQERAVVPLTSLRELEYAAQQVEGDNENNDPEYLKWLYMLMSPGSSLGGARPKASVYDEEEHLWIAKFPSRYDEYDMGAWEYVVYQLARNAGIEMPECRIEKFNNPYHTFLTKRFDRTPESRLHFSSAMTQLGYYDGDYDASYLEIAQFLTEQGANTRKDLAQLWRRIIFNIAVSNTDDHLRNHGFIFTNGGWILSPAYDINPVTPATGLHLNITEHDNRLNYDLAMEVIAYFQLTAINAEEIKSEVLESVRQWDKVAEANGINRRERQRMEPAFNGLLVGY